MRQQPRASYDFSTDFDHHVVLFPTRSAAHVLAGLPAKSAGRPITGPPQPVTSRVIRQVVVLDVAGRLNDVVGELDLAIQLALTEGSRGVVCDLSAALEGAEPASVDMLAAVGRHVRDWPGIPVAVACPDPQVRAALAADPLGGHLIVRASLRSAVSTVLATPAPAVEWLHLAPHPTAPRASLDFVTRILLDWGLAPLVRSAGLVVRELVANSMHAGTDIDVSVAWNLGALRLTVRDNSPDLPGQPFSHHDPHARRLSVVAVLSHAFGVLPTADGGRVVWAVLDAARPRSSTSPPRHGPVTATQESPVFTEAPDTAGL
ncbi:MAG: hypothetical protein ABI903_01070 [Actinomycetota bacterium]